MGDKLQSSGQQQLSERQVQWQAKAPVAPTLRDARSPSARLFYRTHDCQRQVLCVIDCVRSDRPVNLLPSHKRGRDAALAEKLNFR